MILDPVPGLTDTLCSPQLSKPQGPCLRSGVDSYPLTVLWAVVKLQEQGKFAPWAISREAKDLSFPLLPTPHPGGARYVRVGA